MAIDIPLSKAHERKVRQIAKRLKITPDAIIASLLEDYINAKLSRT